MDEAIKINSGAVSSLADSDLVLAATSGGTYRPVSMANLLSQISNRLGVSHVTQIVVTSGDWVRIAKTTSQNATFCGILSVSHSWFSGCPIPLLCYINGSGTSSASSYNAEQLTSGKYYESTSDMGSLSFTKVRFVNDNGIIYVEVKFKTGSVNTQRIWYSLSGQIALELIDATISTASAANVLKEIDLSGGVMLRNSIGYGLKEGGQHDRGNTNRRRSYTLSVKDGVIQRLAEGDTDRHNGISGTGNMLGRLRDTGLLYRGCKFILRVPAKYQSLELRHLGSDEEECRYYPSLHTCGRINSVDTRPAKQRVATVVPADHGTGVQLKRKEVTYV